MVNTYLSSHMRLWMDELSATFRIYFNKTSSFVGSVVLKKLFGVKTCAQMWRDLWEQMVRFFAVLATF